MNSAIYNNPYTLLALFISPWTKFDDKEFLVGLLRQRLIPWEQLLWQANNNLCTPLWYVCLKKEGFLGFLPDDLQNYLRALYEANLERNAFFIEALSELQEKFYKRNIPFIILKGGAALCDNLYNDSGARLLQDLDILMKPEYAEYACQILMELGYEEIKDPNKLFEGIPTDKRHHHLNALRKPATPVVIEIHYRTGYAQVGELLPAAEAWEKAIEVEYSKNRMLIFNPTWRLIHNTAHALIPQAEFIKGSISLQQLVEFNFIASKYGSRIIWHDWLARGQEKGFKNEFLAYLTLGHNLMGLGVPDGFEVSLSAKWHATRIIAVGNCYNTLKAFAKSRWQRFQIELKRFMLRSYYLLRLPAWVWHNVCYTETGGNFLLRIKYFFKKVFSPRSRAKI